MPSKKIEDCVPALQAAWPKIKKAFDTKFPGWTMILTHTHRAPEEQFELFKLWRQLNRTTKRWDVVDASKIVTYKDGKRLVSKHNEYPARAFDVALLDPDKKARWDVNLEQWQSLPALAAKVGVVNGGSWTTFRDFPHFEV